MNAPQNIKPERSEKRHAGAVADPLQPGGVWQAVKAETGEEVLPDQAAPRLK
jgi:hypothetical protein